MSDLRTTAQKLVNVLDASLYMNDYSGLEVSKNSQPVVSDAIEALREQLTKSPEQNLVTLDAVYEAWYSVGIDLLGGDLERFYKAIEAQTKGKK